MISKKDVAKIKPHFHPLRITADPENKVDTRPMHRKEASAFISLEFDMTQGALLRK